MDTEPDNNINAFQQTCFGQFTITYITNVWKLSSFSKLFCKFNHDFTQKITIVIVLCYIVRKGMTLLSSKCHTYVYVNDDGLIAI